MENKYTTDIQANLDRYLEDLYTLLRIPSISAKPEHKEQMNTIAKVYKELFEKYGFSHTEIIETDGHPAVFASRQVSNTHPTILIYGHMDVMPVEPIELWKTPPFEPSIIDEKIVARGADDNKGQTFMHLAAIDYICRTTGNFPCNIKVILEGEEEIGSINLESIISQHKEKLAADFILVSDTSMISKDVPSITSGLRGLAYWEIEVTGPNRDLHSGIFGGAVANPINTLSKIISSLTDDDGKITIPGFYDDVTNYSDEERQLINDAPFNTQAYKENLGIKELSGEKGYSTLERVGIRPSLDVCGIWGGYTGKGTKTVLPSKAYAKLSTRLVAKQDFRKISKLVKDHIESNAQKGYQVTVTELHGGQPYECPIDHPAYQIASDAIFEIYGKRPVPYKSGGSIPIIAKFEEILGIKTILLGFGLESDAIHSPNENFPLSSFKNGIATLIEFYQNVKKKYHTT